MTAHSDKEKAAGHRCPATGGAAHDTSAQSAERHGRRPHTRSHHREPPTDVARPSPPRASCTSRTKGGVKSHSRRGSVSIPAPTAQFNICEPVFLDAGWLPANHLGWVSFCKVGRLDLAASYARRNGPPVLAALRGSSRCCRVAPSTGTGEPMQRSRHRPGEDGRWTPADQGLVSSVICITPPLLCSLSTRQWARQTASRTTNLPLRSCQS